MTKIAIALGANLGDRLNQLKLAAARIANEFLEEAASSNVYETPPWGITDQPPFLNAVLCGYTDWKPPALLNYLKALEMELGRKHGVRNGPREIDLDLVAYGEKTWDSPEIVVPHPRMHDREFVLKPLNDIWPEWRHPGLGKTTAELLKLATEKAPSAATYFSAPLLSKESR